MLEKAFRWASALLILISFCLGGCNALPKEPMSAVENTAFSKGSVDAAGVILDIDRTAYAGPDAPIRLYFDIDNWEQPMALVGFTCDGSFPMEAL